MMDKWDKAYESRLAARGKWYQTHKEAHNAKCTERSKRVAEQRKRDRQCIYCGEPLPDDCKYVTCEGCRAFARMKRNARKQAGLCVWCSEPAYKDKSLCFKHLLKARESVKTRQHKQKEMRKT